MITRDDKVRLGVLQTRDDAGRHFTDIHAFDWLIAMEEAGYITIDRPVHEPTGIPYERSYWRVQVSPEVAEWFDEFGDLKGGAA